MEKQTINTTDLAIIRCEEIIQKHSKKANQLLAIVLFVTIAFIFITSIPLISQYTNIGRTTTIIGSGTDNNYIKKINDLKINNISQYDSLINKAISFQKLLNAKNQENISFRKSIETKQEASFSDYILYGIFILLFGVFTSLYRFHLKEISRQEHYLIGFQRIRIAGVNSTSKYDDEVKIALTNNAFSFDPEKGSKDIKSIESPVQGHPTSDIATSLINKILEKVDFTPKK